MRRLVLRQGLRLTEPLDLDWIDKSPPVALDPVAGDLSFSQPALNGAPAQLQLTSCLVDRLDCRHHRRCYGHSAPTNAGIAPKPANKGVVYSASRCANFTT